VDEGLLYLFMVTYITFQAKIVCLKNLCSFFSPFCGGGGDNGSMKLDFTDSCPHQQLPQLALLTVIQLY
jgi:hypothetical protein